MCTDKFNYQNHCSEKKICSYLQALCGDKHMTSKGPCPPPNTMDLFIINTWTVQHLTCFLLQPALPNILIPLIPPPPLQACRPFLNCYTFEDASLKKLKEVSWQWWSATKLCSKKNDFCLNLTTCMLNCWPDLTDYISALFLGNLKARPF